MKIEFKVSVEMSDEQVRLWAENIGINVAAVESDVASYLCAILQEDTVSPYWITEVN